MVFLLASAMVLFSAALSLSVRGSVLGTDFFDVIVRALLKWSGCLRLIYTEAYPELHRYQLPCLRLYY
jgi:hypothetical protein